VATLTLLVTPVWMILGGRLSRTMQPAGWQTASMPGAPPPSTRRAGEQLSDHIILCGYGRVGSQIGEVLSAQRHPFVVIDYEQYVVGQLAARGAPVIYGDASSGELLAAAGAQRARLAVVALPEGITTRLAVRELRRLNPSLPVVARAHSRDEMAEMCGEGASQVIYAEFEAALEMLRETLLALGQEASQVQSLIDGTRQSRYRCAELEQPPSA
jgi:CPA2 family monovalent cation:H+ antiporter-2